MFKCIAHVEVGQSEKFCSSQLPRICCSRNLPNSQMVDNEFETWAIDFHHYRNKSFIAPAIYMIPTLKGQGNCQQEAAMFASSYTQFLISHTKCTIASSWLERKGELRKGESFVSVMVKIYCPGSNSLSSICECGKFREQPILGNRDEQNFSLCPTSICALDTVQDFFDRVGHQTTYAYMGNKHFFH